MMYEVFETERDKLEEAIAKTKPWEIEEESHSPRDGYALVSTRREKLENGSYVLKATWQGRKSDILTITFDSLNYLFSFLPPILEDGPGQHIEAFNTVSPWPVELIGCDPQKRIVIARRKDAFESNASPSRAICIEPDNTTWMAIQGELYGDDKKCGFGATASEAFADWIATHGEPENPNLK